VDPYFGKSVFQVSAFSGRRHARSAGRVRGDVHHHRAQIAEVLIELKWRHRHLVCAMDDLAAFGSDDFWRQSALREPFNELAQMTAAHIALLIGEAQMLGA
jgi:hypothetical protein